MSEIVERFIESENREMEWKRFPVIRQRTICVLQAFIVCAFFLKTSRWTVLRAF